MINGKPRDTKCKFDETMMDLYKSIQKMNMVFNISSKEQYSIPGGKDEYQSRPLTKI
jgi:hypothetical protein